MHEVKQILKNLITLENLVVMSPSDIINEIASNQYNKSNRHIKERNVFVKLPVVIKDILLLADFDTELNMSGILGFLENSSGLFLSETIDTLERIGAYEDMEVLRNISIILNRYGVSTQTLRNNVNKENLYDITNFSNTHGAKYNEMADKIVEEAEKLYVYSYDRNIFDNLIIHIEKNKKQLAESML